MRGKKVKELRKKVWDKWEKLEGKKTGFKTAFRRVKKAYVLHLIKDWEE